MSTYDEREKGFERKFAHDEEIAFKTHARRNKLLGQWAAGKLGKTGADAEQYAMEVAMVDFDKGNADTMVQKILTDFTAAKLPITQKDIRIEMERLLEVARTQIAGASQ